MHTHTQYYIYTNLYITRGTDFPPSRNRGKPCLKRNSRISAKTLLISSKKHTLLSKRSFQRDFENKWSIPDYTDICKCYANRNPDMFVFLK